MYFGFGSISEFAREHLADVISHTVKRLRVRAVVQGGWSGLSVQGDDILGVDECPHAWLLPRMAAAVHHAGPGATHACLQAGTPALPVPITLDQPFWASRLHALELTPTVIPMRHLDGDNLIHALGRLLADGGIADGLSTSEHTTSNSRTGTPL
ncbi:glycosyltransferase [Streptomyces syringium]|uniref:glycosyltransferase n=1 Tax=Streptomyces syringium TaxID=76729 RepID=UPI0037CFE961